MIGKCFGLERGSALADDTGMIQTLDTPVWLVDAARTILEFDKLPPNWDSYNARPIRRDIIFAAIYLLPQIVRPDTPQPAVVPMSSGGVQFEWHQRDIDLEIRLFLPDRFEVSFEDFTNGSNWADQFNLGDLDRVKDAIAALTHHP